MTTKLNVTTKFDKSSSLFFRYFHLFCDSSQILKRPEPNRSHARLWIAAATCQMQGNPEGYSIPKTQTK